MYGEAAIASLLQGMTVGLAVAAPIGPSSLLCIQRALRSRAAGWATGAGIATVHGVYASLAVGGTAALGASLSPHLGAFRLLSAVLLVILAMRAYSRASAELSLPDPLRPRSAERSLAAYASAIAFGAANPMTLLFFLATLPSLLLVQGPDRPEGWAALFVAGIAFGSVLWWSGVVTLVRILRERVLRPRWSFVINRAAAVSLAIAGLSILMPEIRLRLPDLLAPALAQAARETGAASGKSDRLERRLLLRADATPPHSTRGTQVDMR